MSTTKYVKYLGSGRTVADQTSPKHHVRFNTNGLDEPSAVRLIRKLEKKGAPQAVVSRLEAFPERPIGEWIDEAVDQTLTLFLACGGQVASRAADVNPSRFYVEIMDKPFKTPPDGRIAAGAYFPSEDKIQVVAFYWSEGQQWLRHCQDLLLWEFCNAYSIKCGITPETADNRRPNGWPCR